MQIFLNILLFIVCLSTLIMVHEAGHLSAAKIFKVYCEDFSIGFGKAFFHKKRKNGETYFSLRIIPFGGYVAMADQGGETASGFVVPPERSINGTKKWKAAIIMAAGVIMNFLLAIVLLFCNNMFFEQKTFFANALDILEGSKAALSGVVASEITNDGKWKSGDLVLYQTDPRETKLGERHFYYDTRAVANFEDGSTLNVYGVMHEKELMTYKNFEYAKTLHFYKTIVEEDKTVNANYAVPEITYDYKNEAGSKLKSVTIYPQFYRIKEGSYFCSNCLNEGKIEDLIKVGEGDNAHYHCPNCDKDKTKMGNVIFHTENSDKYITPIEMMVDEENKGFENVGLNLFYRGHWNTFGEAWVKTFDDFGSGASQIFVAIGNLFVGQGWEDTGSIITIYTQSSQMLEARGFGYYLWYWGLISINLGIFNLLPFPGLDGWQLLVLGVEGITRKKIPEKAKVIMSYVGLGLLMILMVVLLVKDFIGIF